ncbi:MAG: UvrD-helicase domain-containing protein [Bacilli bacterium]|nr:UvrD-helicase domain-containing protein [Bacilli bacterium]MDD4053358.1 UvrD-helicase domain-containing protein [Bacilli bacterium]MDD4410995.1 UvrD-helicase domain-containing protein [Bacilli bacterium]
MDLSKLNDKQREAVEYVNGPLLILAGAGSGKTSVLTNRVAYLINEVGIAPQNILAITFTNKAAKEMKERIFSLIGDIAAKVQISTFHSFGYRIVRENYQFLGLEKNFTILDESDAITIIKRILKDINLDPKHYPPRSIKNSISGAKNALMNAEAYSKFVNTPWDEIVIKIYRLYEEKLKKSNAVDFDDLLMMPITLFKNHPDVLSIYQEKFKYILIDEYQDTNEAQYKLSKMISAKYKNICVVGDNDQSIYSFRGANYNNILNFEKDYANTKVILLEENYRSTKTILNAANDVIKNNKLRKDKNLWTSNDTGNKIKYYRAYDEKDEVAYVVMNVKRAHEEGVPYENMAVLYRTNAQSRVMEEFFMMESIPYKVVGAFAFYNRREIRDLVAYLKLIYNEKDNVNLLRCINSPKRGIGAKTIENLQTKAECEDKSIYEVIDSGKELAFKKIIEDLKEKAAESSLTELVDYVINHSGMRQDLVNEKSIEADIRLENLEEFKSITKGFEERSGLVSLEEFLMQVSLVSNSEDVKDEFEKVSLMTMHAAKGLEFDIVFAVGIEEGIMPHNGFDTTESDIEEERRLFYVAITRAKKQLFILNARMRMLFGDRQVRAESSFIKEINEDYIDAGNVTKAVTPTIINKADKFYAEGDVDYKAGDYVYHNDFGEGIVVSVDKSIMSVSFAYPHQVKKLLKNHKSIKKI